MKLKEFWQRLKDVINDVHWSLIGDELPDIIRNHEGVTEAGYGIGPRGRDMRRCVTYCCRGRSAKGSIFCLECIDKPVVSLSSRKPYAFPIDIQDRFKSIRSQCRVEFSRMRRKLLATTPRHCL